MNGTDCYLETRTSRPGTGADTAGLIASGPRPTHRLRLWAFPSSPAADSKQLFEDERALSPRNQGPGVSFVPVARRSSRLEEGCKRALGLVGASVAIVLLLPLLIVTAILVRLSSRGPVLFRQTRLGKNGKPFTIYKFRTMVVDAEQRLAEVEARNESQGGVLFKLKDDPRTIPLGRFLRRSSIDELPQLFNVLMGNMSLVGPRPLQLRDCRLLAQKDPMGYAYRLTRKPGITGLWQVRGRSDTGFETMLVWDTEYVRECSLGMDLRILFETVGCVLQRQGAY